MTVTITAYEQSPDGGKGLARDTHVPLRAGRSRPALRGPRRFVQVDKGAGGQIPTCEEGDLVLFETGAIVFHIAERHTGLLPDDANARARAITWMFAALNTVEPPILELVTGKLLENDKSWSKARMPLVEDRVRDRLNHFPLAWATRIGSMARSARAT
jgi:glutathione S-transferase